MMTFKLTSFVLTVLALVSSTRAFTELVLNGDFELGTPFSSTVPDWSNSDTISSFLDTSITHAGAQSFAVGALDTNPEILSQTIAGTVVGSCYSISVWFFNNQPGTALTVSSTITFGSLTAVVPIDTQTVSTWVQYQYFGLADVSSLLSITSFNNNGYTNIDDVSVQITDPVNCLAPSGLRTRNRRAKRHRSPQW